MAGQIAASISNTRAYQDERKRLRRNEQRLGAFVNASAQIVYRMSPDWTEMYFLEGKDLISDTTDANTDWIATYIPPDDRPKVLAAIQESIRTSSNFELEHRILRQDGSKAWVFSRAVPLIDDAGKIIEWFGIAVDIGEKKLMEQQLRDARAELESRVPEGAAELEPL